MTLDSNNRRIISSCAALGEVADLGPIGIIAELVRDRRDIERLVHPRLRRRSTGIVSRIVIDFVVGKSAIDGAEPLRRKAFGKCRVNIFGRVKHVFVG